MVIASGLGLAALFGRGTVLPAARGSVLLPTHSTCRQSSYDDYFKTISNLKYDIQYCVYLYYTAMCNIGKYRPNLIIYCQDLGLGLNQLYSLMWLGWSLYLWGLQPERVC